MKTNPFATKFIQPGALRYEFFGQTSAEELARKLLAPDSKPALIIGPHGTGKSTLVATLAEELRRLEPESAMYQVRFSANVAARQPLALARRQWTKGAIVLLDGYEQLGFWSRWLVSRDVRLRSLKLLATAHEPIRGFEILWSTYVNEHSSKWVIEQLLSATDSRSEVQQLLESEDWARSRAKHGDNLRESLFDMYDWWHQRDSQ